MYKLTNLSLLLKENFRQTDDRFNSNNIISKEENSMKKNISKKFFLLGLTIFVISYLLPVDIFQSYTSLRPTGLTSMFVCPIIGLIGLIFGIKEKDRLLFILLNILLILLLPIAMFVDHLL